ncbi:MAG TPA: nuclear transport factor 2 family protein [Candidatus Omnitrophota bacterium]|nr:nuclear transport factor 2 family protein [Candidatus Omnitrophota bacterium]
MSSLTSAMPKNWSKKQQHVWKCVEDHWDHLINKRIDAFKEYIHDDFIGFGHESPISIDKPWLEKWVGFWTKSTDIIICELRPIHIEIHADIAIVQYFIFTIEKNAGGGKRVIRRYTMTWKKNHDLWQVIGSHNNLMDETIRG